MKNNQNKKKFLSKNKENINLNNQENIIEELKVKLNPKKFIKKIFLPVRKEKISNYKIFKTSINNNIDAAEASINNNINDAEASINNNINELKQYVGWNTDGNKTVTARLKEIYTDTQKLISKFPNNTYYNSIIG